MSRRDISRELSSSVHYSNYNDFSRSVSVTSPPPRRNGTLSPSIGISTGGRKTPTVLIEERSKSCVMSNDREHLYFPAGYTRCDLKAGRMKVPTFKVTNERAWTNPTPTPWGRDRVQLDFGARGGEPTANGNYEMSNKGVVGKFRSLYTTIEQVKAAFSKYDANRDGNISQKELEDGMVQSGQFSFDEAREAFQIADINGDGEIDISEFVQVMFPTAAEIVSNLRKSFNSMEEVEQTFRQWDLNNDGAICFTELEAAVAKSGRKLTCEEMNAIFVVGDVNQNGEIDLEEFKRLMMPTVSDVVAKFRATHRTMSDVQAAFKKFDCNGDGSIDRSELTSALQSSGQQYTQQEINALFNAADVNKDGTIDFEEFVALMCPAVSDIVSKFRGQYKNIDDVRAAFKRFDRNGDGALSKDELSAALKSSGLSFSDTEVNAIFNIGDADGDGDITLEEFVNLMSPSSAEILKKIRKNFRNINDIKVAFKRIDTNNDGLLSKNEMLSSSGCKFDSEEVNAIFELGDVNGDGEIDMGEFIGLMYPAATEVLSKMSLTYKNINDVRAAFKLLDMDGDGSISRQEMSSSSHRFSNEQVEAIFALGDVNDDGAIDLEEFVGVMCPSAETVVSRIRQKYKNINDVKRAFMSMDTNKDGKISRSEMAAGGKLNSQEVDAIFILGDVNGDGEIDLEEFVGLICPSAMDAVQKFTKTIKNIQEAQMLFRILDKNGDGMISMEEMQSCGQKFSRKEIEAIFAIGDLNGDGEIDMNEFVSVMCPSASTVVQRISKSFRSLEEIKQAFRKFDRDGDGQISKQEMKSAGYNDQEVDSIFALGDVNNDGQIDIDEFITVMCPSASAVVFKVSKLFQSTKSAEEAFKRIDVNGDGKISKDEMKNANLSNGARLNHIEVEAIFALGDVDRDGEIDLQEFMSVMMPSAGFSSSFSSSSNVQFMKTSSSKQSFSSVQSFSSSSAQSYSSTTTYSSTAVSISFSSASEVKKAFAKFDVNGDGHLDKSELKQLLRSSGKSASDQEVDLLFRQGDIDGDGLIDIQEFIKLMFPAANSTLAKIQQRYSSLNDVKTAFRKYDADGDGHITKAELRQVMNGFSDQEVDSIFALGDKDQNGGIDYQEFVAMMIPNSSSTLKQVSSQFSSVESVKDAFKRIDTNGDGAISRQELKNGLRLSDNAVDIIFAIGDSNQDNEICLSEFLRLMLPSAASALNRLRNSFRDIAEAIIAFKKFDANNDGTLSQQELSRGVQSIGLNFSPQEVSSIFSMADVNKDNEIDYIEFVSSMFPSAADGLSKFRSRLGAITDVRVAFKRFDADGDGSISVIELKNGAGSGFTSGEIAAVFALGDVDQDGTISFSEFAQLVLPSAREKVGQLKQSFGNPNEAKDGFNRFDVNRDGKISYEELRNGLQASGIRMNDQEVMTIFAIADLDGDGEICLDEFMTLMGFSSNAQGSGAKQSNGALKINKVEDVKAAFRRFDINGDGHLDRNEFRQFSSAIGYQGNPDGFFQQADIDGDGKVDYQELIKIMFPESAKALAKMNSSFRSLNEVKAAFKRFDADGDGHISRQELQQVVPGLSSNECDAVFALGDKDQSGGIDYQEFIGLMLPSAPAVIAKLSQNFRSIANIKDSFKKFDMNGDHQISRNELKNGMRLSDSDLDVVFALGDLDGDGEISMSEFVCIMSPVASRAVSRFRNCFKNISELVSAFRQFDSNSDGSISMAELAAGMRNMRMSFSNEETNAIYAASDINQDGEISYTEFVSLMIPTAGDALSKFRKSFSGIKNAKDAFNRFDSDGDEEITISELRNGMGGNFSENEVNAVFALGDTDQDGKISFLEFAKLMIPSASDALAKFWKCFRDLKVIRQAFKQFDVDNDGFISRKEVMDGMARSGRNFTSDEIDALFLLADNDNNGVIDFAEFAQIMIPSAPERLMKLRNKYSTKAEVENAFKRFDSNNDGAIDFNEMRVGLQRTGILLTEQEIETIFAIADVDGDGQVNMSEFVAVMCPGSGSAPVSSRSSGSTSGGASNVINKFRSQYKTVEDVRQAFNVIDTNRDGAIDRRELAVGMSRIGQFSQADSDVIFDLADSDGNGEIDIGEFVCLMFPNAAQLVSDLKGNFRGSEDVRNAFNSWDTNRDGQISFQELKQAVQRAGQRLSDEQISALFVIGDADQNGEIDLDEFMKMMMPGTSDVVAKFRSVRKTVRDVQQAFKQFDRNGDGSIDRAELTSALMSSGGNFTKQEVDVIFTAADVDGNGEIDYEEFIALMCPSASDIVEKFRGKYRNVNDVKAAFKLFDKNGDGALSKDELASALKSSGESYSEIEVNAIFSLGDVDGDGEITLEEFVSLMSPSATQIIQKLRGGFKNLSEVKGVFKKIDTNNDGLLSKDEMSRAGKFDAEEVNAIFELGDVNGDGEIDIGEFIGVLFPSAVEVAMQVSSNFRTLDDVKSAFKLLDKDGDGNISKSEMLSSGHRFNQSQVDAVFALGDVNDDGVIDLDEFISVMCPSALTIVSRLRGKYKNISEVKKAFLAIDTNKDGVLSKSEIASSGKFNNSEIEAMFILGDVNQDGEIDLEEFVGLMSPTAAMAIARLSRNVKNITEAQQMFKVLDKNNDGLISQEEMRACGSRFNNQEIEAIFAIGDINNDGEIDFNEFVGVMCPSASTVVGRLGKTYKTLEEIKQGFKKLDRDGDGRITKSELKQAGFSDQEVNAVFALGDVNQDGEIDMQEFIAVMCPSAVAVVNKIASMFKDKNGAAAMFKKIDINGDGLISKSEMASASFGREKLTNLEVDAIFQLGDINKDGEIDIQEFLAIMTPSPSSVSVQSSSMASFSKTTTVSSSFSSSFSSSSTSTSFYSVDMAFGSVHDAKSAFKKFDVNGDGVMDLDEMKQMMSFAKGKSVPESEVQALFRKGDLDGDGQIDMQEFIKLMFPSSSDALAKLNKSFRTVEEAKTGFRKCDTDGDGHISKDELRSLMSGFSGTEVDAVFALADKDMSGGIDYSEFIALMIPGSGSILRKIASSFNSIQQVMDGFKKIDANGDGAISRNELKNGMRLSDQELDVVFALGDVDQDGEISLSEFVRLMCPAAESGLSKFRNSFRNIQEVVAAFKLYDSNADGSICQQELMNGVKQSGIHLSGAEMKAIYALADVNQDGEISYFEFISALFPIASDGISKIRRSLTSLKSVKDAFKRFDADGDGEITYQELKQGSSSVGSFSEGELSAVFAVADKNNDGKISFSEFARMVMPSVDDIIFKLKKSLGTVADIKKAFQRIDANNDGNISSQELKNGLRSMGLNFSEQELEAIFAVADLDGDGEISVNEFEHLLGAAVSLSSVEDVKAAFFRFDQNNDGSIDKNELKLLLTATGKTPSQKEVDDLFRKGDLDNDGNIDLQEFIKLMFPAAYQAVAKLQQSFKSLNEMKSCFKKYDIDGDGHISRAELRKAMSRFSEQEVDSVYALGDKDHSGGIDYQEFVYLMLPNASEVINRLSSQFRSVMDIKAAFKRIDANGDGQINRDELRNGMRLSDKDLDVVFAVGDLDGDGEINVGEFVRIVCPSSANALARFRNSFCTIEDVVAAFRSIDLNNDGSITRQELAEGMNSYGKNFTEKEINAVFELGDVNSDGEINYTEFVSMMFPAAATALAKFRRSCHSLQNAKEAFNRFDVDGDEEISYNELVEGLGGSYTANEINAIFAMGDIDQDGKISFLEFAKIMMPCANEALTKFWKAFQNISNVRQAFQKFDADRDGQISRQEILNGMSSVGLKLTSSEIDTLFILGDKDSNGQIDFSEFAQIMIPSATERICKLKRCFRNPAEVEAAFRRFDTNHDGAISFEELKAGLQSSGIIFSPVEIETCFAVADCNCDGEVSLSEFVHLFSSSSGSSQNGQGAIANFFNFCVAEAFKKLDTNNDGSLSFQELASALRPVGFSDEDIHTVFTLADHDGDGEISLEELIRALRK